MDAERPADGDSVQEQTVQEDSLKSRIQAWVGSSNCWCDKDDGKVYCTVCELLIDALDRIEYLEDLVEKKIQAAENGVEDGCGNTVESPGQPG